MAPKTIDITGSLVRKSTAGLTKSMGRDALFVEIKAQGLSITLDDDDLARRAVEAIKSTVISNAQRGLDPSGRPLPSSDADTIERRRYRAEQADRGGSASPKFSKDAFPTARKSFRKRFFNSRVPGGSGGLHKPSGSGVPHGKFSIESMLFWRSAAVARIGAGRFGLFFANTRALLDKSGKSAIERIAKKVRFWSPGAMQQPQVQLAMKNYVKDAIRRTTLGDLKDLGRALLTTVQRSRSILNQMESDSSGR